MIVWPTGKGTGFVHYVSCHRIFFDWTFLHFGEVRLNPAGKLIGGVERKDSALVDVNANLDTAWQLFLRDLRQTDDLESWVFGPRWFSFQVEWIFICYLLIIYY